MLVAPPGKLPVRLQVGAAGRAQPIPAVDCLGPGRERIHPQRNPREIAHAALLHLANAASGQNARARVITMTTNPRSEDASRAGAPGRATRAEVIDAVRRDPWRP